MAKAKNEAKIKFTADCKEFNKDIKASNDEMSRLRAEMKLNETQMKATGVSVEGLENKHRILEDQLEASEKKTEALSQKVEKAVEIFGENSDEVNKLRIQLINAQNAEEKIRQAISQCNSELEEQRAAADKVETETEKLTNTIKQQQTELDRLKSEYTDVVLEFGEASDEAKRLEREIRDLSGELQQNRNRMDDAAAKADRLDRSLDDVGEEAEDAADGFSVLDGAMSILVAGALTAFIGKIGDAVSGLASLADETREYREDIAKLETAFEDAGHTTKEATGVYKELYSVFGEEDRAVEAAQQIAMLADNQAEMTLMTNIATGAWAKWGDSLATESLMEAVNSTAKIGEVQGTLADALEWCGVNLDDFNEALATKTTEEDRSTYILETLNGLYSESADKYRENNKSIIESRKATSDYTDTLADLGEVMEPLDTKVTELKNNFAKELAPVLEKKIIPAVEDFFDRLEDSGAIEDIAEMLGDLAEAVLPPLAEILGFVAENWELLAIGIGTAVTALKTFQIINTVRIGIQGATTAMGVFNGVMAANPIGAVATALGGLAAVVIGFSALLGDAKTELDYVSEALEENTEKNRKWQETMDSASVSIGDWSNFANAAGDTAYSLTSKMEDAQNKITQIWAKANAENRKLRADEIADIKQYNQDYINALNELAALNEQRLQAQVDMLKWKLENEKLTMEQQQGILNTLEEIQAEHTASMEQLVQQELVTLQQRLSNGQITQEEYNTQREQTLAKLSEYANTEKGITQGLVDDALEKQRQQINIDVKTFTERTHHFKSVNDIYAKYGADKKKIQDDETLNDWEKYLASNAVQALQKESLNRFYKGQEATWTDYNFMVDENIQHNIQAFFNWAANCKSQGIELDKENKATAKAILDAYSDLPEDLEEAGLESLRGLAEGMAAEYPELESAAEMDMEELIAAMNSALGVNSPSTKMISSGQYVMEGLKTGMNSKLPDLRSVVTGIGESIISAFKEKMKIKSPSKIMYGLGEFIPAAVINSIEDGTAPMVRAVNDQVDAVLGAYQSADMSRAFSLNPDSSSLSNLHGELNELLSVQIATQNGTFLDQLEQLGDNIINAMQNMHIDMDGRTVAQLIYDPVSRNMARADAVRGGGF
jgi:chromosome segregation ATPase